jgi:hypothetical protein
MKLIFQLSGERTEDAEEQTAKDDVLITER